jgi:ABC-type enterochelin transport system permease subunit
MMAQIFVNFGVWETRLLWNVTRWHNGSVAFLSKGSYPVLFVLN